MSKNHLLFLLVFFINSNLFSQHAASEHLLVEGLVYGYKYDPTIRLFKKDKQLKIDGVLENAKIEVVNGGQIILSTHTNTKGSFSFKIKLGRSYLLEFSKEGYSSIIIAIDLTNVPEQFSKNGIQFVGTEFLLNQFQFKNEGKTKEPFGTLFFNTQGNYLDFKQTEQSSRKQREYYDNPFSMIQSAVKKNKTNSQIIDSKKTNKISTTKGDEINKTSVGGIRTLKQKDTLTGVFSKIKVKNNLNQEDILVLEERVNQLKEEIEQDLLKSGEIDSVRLLEKKNILNNLENELIGAKKIIELQKSRISTQRQLLFVSVASLILLLGMMFIILRFNKQKKEVYIQLKEKNKKITDSINYAKRIQESILPSEQEIKKLLPDSFIYFQPRDVVSGDFYWLSIIGKKIVIACIDCTGHGIPGAFMSLIGNTLLNEIVNEKEIVDPSKILKALHHGIVKSLHQEDKNNSSKDGMEISLCVIDKETNTINYAGAMNPMYIVKGGDVLVVKPDINSIGGDGFKNNEVLFTNQVVPIEKGMTIYMFTDGYMDQFGGTENKKYNVKNFQELLIHIQKMNMDEQKGEIEKAIQIWKGNQKQIDDMLVIGIRF